MFAMARGRRLAKRTHQSSSWRTPWPLQLRPLRRSPSRPSTPSARTVRPPRSSCASTQTCGVKAIDTLIGVRQGSASRRLSIDWLRSVTGCASRPRSPTETPCRLRLGSRRRRLIIARPVLVSTRQPLLTRSKLVAHWRGLSASPPRKGRNRRKTKSAKQNDQNDGWSTMARYKNIQKL